MHKNSGLAHVADKEEVMRATLDTFVENYKDVVVVDDETSLEELCRNYVKTCPKDHTVCFYECTDIMNQYKTWFNVFGNVQPFYAMKCNPSKGMMALMTTLPGVCIDCAGIDEMKTCFEAGITADHIIYANPIKSLESVQFMKDHGVWCSTVDCVEEIEKMHSVLGEDAEKCRNVIRLWVDDSHSVVALGSKFGCHLDEVEEMLKVSEKHHMQVVGVAFHVGTGNSDEYAYDKAIRDAKIVFDLGKKYGFHMNLLDMGGGWSGDLGKEFRNPLLESTRDVIITALSKYEFDKIEELKVISEPGRYFNSYTIHIACTIESVMKRNGEYIYRINEGVMGVFKDITLCDIVVEGIPLLDTKDKPLYHSMILGPSNQKGDVIIKSAEYPIMNVGDRILFPNLGAYTLSLTTLPLRTTQKYVYFVRKSSLSS